MQNDISLTDHEKLQEQFMLIKELYAFPYYICRAVLCNELQMSSSHYSPSLKMGVLNARVKSQFTFFFS